MMKQFKETIKAYIFTLVLVVYCIGVLTIAHETTHTWQGVLVVIIGMIVLGVNIYLLE